MNYVSIDPIAFSVGSFGIHWYGIMYLLGFLSAWILGKYRAKRSNAAWTTGDVEDLLTWTMIGVVLGGRFGYMLFYDLPVFLSDPLELFRLWNGGMSFHGGALGVLLAVYIWSYKKKRSFLCVLDFLVPLIPPGLFWGRIGNFINGELWGSITDKPWGIIFPHGGPYPRHPSQLYEAFFEGLILFIILWIYTQKPRKKGTASGLFALLYGVFRFGIEFIRQPDAHLGYLAFGWLTMGQILCLPLIIIGIWLLVQKKQRVFVPNSI